jgi:rod shape-determining protein MreC
VVEQGKQGGRARRAVPPVLMAASLVCLIVSTRSLQGLPESIGLTVLGFFQRGFSAVGSFVADTATSIAELRKLRDNYRELAAKLDRYTNMERGMADLREENKRLKEQLGLSAELGYQRIAAHIVAKDPENLYSTITVDKGVGDGIRKNMPVIAFQDGIEGLVGRVVEVGRGVSMILPLYDSGSYVAARLADGARYEGLVGGKGSADEPLLMRFVKKRAKDEVQFGDLVVTTGFESVYPPEVAIGRVKGVSAPDFQTSVDIELDPVLDFSRLEYVFVIKPASPVAAQGNATAAGSAAPAAGE